MVPILIHLIMKKITVKFYRSETGKEPVKEWLLELSKDDKKVVGVDIKTVEFGWPIGMPVCKPLGSGLYEVRSSLQSNRIARVIFCIEGSEMILLHGFIKKTQKTPQEDLEMAKKRYRRIKNG